jgi:hypothetical protein
VNAWHIYQVGTARVTSGVYSRIEGSTIVTLSHLRISKRGSTKGLHSNSRDCKLRKGQKEIKPPLTIASWGFIEEEQKSSMPELANL